MGDFTDLLFKMSIQLFFFTFFVFIFIRFIARNYGIQVNYLSLKITLQNSELTYTEGLKSKPLPLSGQPVQEYF